MLDRPGPLDLSERRVDEDHLVEGDDPRQQDGHALAVLAAAGIDGHESAATDHLPVIGRHGNVGDGVAAGAGPATGDRMGTLAALASWPVRLGRRSRCAYGHNTLPRNRASDARQT